MLDVHAHHQSALSVRDFFIHLLTITVGLLIALGLEASVEAIHHHHQRKEAEALIRQEIRTNTESLEKAATQGDYSIIKERENLSHFITMTRGVLNGEQPPAGQKFDLRFHEEEIPDSAWRTASNTGVLEYMPYDEVERFGDAYREQALLQSMAQKALEDYLELGASIDATQANQGKNPFASKDDAVRAMQIAQRAYGHLNGIVAAGQGTMESYKKALQ